MKRIKIFFDTEFTELSTQSKIISIGCISENGDTFYAEFNNIHESELNQWVKDNVLKHCIFRNQLENIDASNNINIEKTNNGLLHMKCVGDKRYVKDCLVEWLKNFSSIGVEFWGDCLAYDWVLLNDLWENALNLPEFIHYIPLDISTLLYVKSVDNNVNRIVFSDAEKDQDIIPHNALSDACIIKKCYEKLMNI